VRRLTDPHTTAFARCTPILKDFSRRISSPRVPRFRSPTLRRLSTTNSAPSPRLIRARVAMRRAVLQRGRARRVQVRRSERARRRRRPVASREQPRRDRPGELKARSSITLVPIRPRRRGARRSLRTLLPGASLRQPPLGFNSDAHTATPFNSTPDAFELHLPRRRFAWTHPRPSERRWWRSRSSTTSTRTRARRR